MQNVCMQVLHMYVRMCVCRYICIYYASCIRVGLTRCRLKENMCCEFGSLPGSWLGVLISRPLDGMAPQKTLESTSNAPSCGLSNICSSEFRGSRHPCAELPCAQARAVIFKKVVFHGTSDIVHRMISELARSLSRPYA